MVQLIAVLVFRTICLICYFNSTMVQLIASFSNPLLSVVRLFQFYYGSINRRSGLWKEMFRIYFNSTMVQLIASIIFLKFDSSSYFNSTMVQLIEFCNN